MQNKSQDSTLNSIFFNQSAKIFYAVCVYRSFTEAAKQLGITQSAVNQCIANLEKQLQFDLFDRSVRPLCPTQEALVLRDQILHQIGEFATTLDAIHAKNFIQTSVSVGVIESIGRCVGPEIISGLVDQGRYVELRSGTSDHLYQELLKDRVDCIIATGQLFDAENLERELIYTEPHIVMMPKEIASAHANWTWENLNFCGLPMVRYSSNTGSGEQGERILRHANLNLPKRFSVDDNQVVFALVAAGMGWCLTQPITALLAKDLLDKVCLIPAPAPCTKRKVYIVWKKETPRIFADELKAICRKALKDKAVPRIIKMIPWTENCFRFD